MPQRRVHARTSAAGWGLRLLLATTAAAFGYLSVKHSLGLTLKSDPELAHVLAPYDGRVTARVAQKLLTPDMQADDRAAAERLARLALRQDPTAVRAVITLGLTAQLRGDTAGARRLFAYADALSRRELQSQLWGIEDAVARNDISGALRRYDIALRTSRSAPGLLFPVLAMAVDDPNIRPALAKTLARDPVWGPSFILYSSAHSPPRAATIFFKELPSAGVQVTEEPRARLINRLIQGNFLADAWSYYSASGRSFDRRMSRDPHFNAKLAIPTPFDWTPVDTAGINSLIQPGEDAGLFDFSAPATVGGPVLMQMQMLTPGNYQLEGRSIGIDQPESSRPYWVLSCHGGGELGRVVLPNSGEANGAFSGRFSVPAGCQAQSLTLVVRPSDLVTGVSGQISQVRIFPVR